MFCLFGKSLSPRSRVPIPTGTMPLSQNTECEYCQRQSRAASELRLGGGVYGRETGAKGLNVNKHCLEMPMTLV